ncbi:cytochrome P450 [Trametes elegans]|nr:cytochrome P450 [Trametes elegans]
MMGSITIIDDLCRSVLNALGILFCFYAVKTLVSFRRAIQPVHGWPGFRTVFSGKTFTSSFRIRGISPGLSGVRYKEFQDAGCDVMVRAHALPSVHLIYMVADPAIVSEILGSRARFPKLLREYKVLRTFGSNIVATEGGEWKHQRKVAAPPFSTRNNRLVWNETLQIVDEMIREVWKEQDVVELDHITDITSALTLLTIGTAGFGRRMSWDENNVVVQPNHIMTFKDAFTTAAHDLVLRVIFPMWMLRLGTARMRSFARAYSELTQYLQEMVETRRSSTTNAVHDDLFNNLLSANKGESHEEGSFNDDMLFGNLFIFLVAGYEYTFIHLALYQDVQEKLYQSIQAVLESDEDLIDNLPRLCPVHRVLYETLRHFPAVNKIPKTSTYETTFSLMNAAGKQVTLPVPQGSDIWICASALHMNPKYWDDPEAFKPERFMGEYPREAFVPFSGGARACLGRSFAETEGVAVLAALISQYRVEVQDEPQFAGETFEQRKARLLESRYILTQFPVRAPLIFKRRWAHC